MDISKFNVFFDAVSHQVSVEGVGKEHFPLQSPAGISLITFTLDNLSGAKLASNPIQWVQDGGPVELPPWFVVHRFNDYYFTLWNFNSVPEQVSYEFEIFVIFQGSFFSTKDPTIINDPPVEGGGTGGALRASSEQLAPGRYAAKRIKKGQREPTLVEAAGEGAPGARHRGRPVTDQRVGKRRLVGELGIVG